MGGGTVYGRGESALKSKSAVEERKGDFSGSLYSCTCDSQTHVVGYHNLLPAEGPGVGNGLHHYHDAVLRLLRLFFLGLVRGLLARRHAEKLVADLLEELFFLRRRAVFHVFVHYLGDGSPTRTDVNLCFLSHTLSRRLSLFLCTLSRCLTNTSDNATLCDNTAGSSNKHLASNQLHSSERLPPERRFEKRTWALARPLVRGPPCPGTSPK